MADIQRVLIEFDVNTEQLKPAIDELEQLGQIDKQEADFLRKSNAEAEKRIKLLQQMLAAQKGLQGVGKETKLTFDQILKSVQGLGQAISTGAGKEVLQGAIEGIGDALEEVGITTEDVKKTFEDLGVTIPGTTKKVNDLRTELRRLTNEIAGGKLKGEELEQAKNRAAELANSLRDAQLEIKNLSSDTRNLDIVIESMQGVAAGFQLVEGAAALAGTSSKEFQETLIRLTALMNIANGLQQVKNLLDRQSAAVLAVTNIQMRLQNANLALEGALQSRNIIIKGGAVLVQRALNAAMAANPAGILAVAIAGLAVALFAFSKRAEIAALNQERINRAELESLELLERLRKRRQESFSESINDLQVELDLMKAKGATEVELAAKSLEIARRKRDIAIAEARTTDTSLETLNKLISGTDDLIASRNQLAAAAEQASGNEKDNLDAQVKNLDTLIQINEKQIGTIQSLRKARTDANVEYQAALIQIQVAEDNAAKKREEDRKKELEDQKAARDAAKAASIDQLQDQKAALQGRLANAITGSKEELELQLQVLQKQKEIDLISLDETKKNAGLKLKIKAEELQEELRLTRQAQINAIEDQKAALEARLSSATGQDQLDIQLQILEKQKQIDLLTLQQAGETAGKNSKLLADNLAEQKKLIDEFNEKTRANVFQFNQDQVNTDIQRIQARLAAIQQGTEQELQFQKDLIELQADADKLAAQQTIKDKQLLQATLDNIDAKALADKTAADKAYRDEKARLDQEAADKAKAQQQQINQFIIDSYEQVINTALRINFEQDQAVFNNRLETLNKSREEELNNKKLTEDQKEKINERYARRERLIKQEQAKRQREADLQQAAINGFVGITKSIATLGPPIPPNIAGILGVASVILTTALQVAEISSRPIPKFRHGVESVKGQGTSISDSIMARISVGERVVSAQTNKDYFPALSAIHNRQVPPEVANALLSGYKFKPISEKVMAKATGESQQIDYNRLAMAMYEYMGEDLQELIFSTDQVRKAIDRKGDISTHNPEVSIRSIRPRRSR